jgi:hypothetical protein
MDETATKECYSDHFRLSAVDATDDLRRVDGRGREMPAVFMMEGPLSAPRRLYTSFVAKLYRRVDLLEDRRSYCPFTIRSRPSLK